MVLLKGWKMLKQQDKNKLLVGEKTEELAYQNQMKSRQREKNMLWNQTHTVGMKRMLN